MKVNRSNKRKWFHIKKNTRNRRYPAETMTNMIKRFLANRPTKAEFLLEKAARGVGLYVNANKNRVRIFKPDGAVLYIKW